MVTRVDRVVRTLQGWQENSCNQDLSDVTLEAVQVVFNLQFLQFGGVGVCNGHESLGW